jgi:hypothetical protein
MILNGSAARGQAALKSVELHNSPPLRLKVLQRFAQVGFGRTVALCYRLFT